ncbi:hypothetical protein DY000_02024014 [Brassica cretica]|uniref:Uncharacterized protein n=1 Tax=Brassica cretica TaxID=69181 RepID=A0ABQ7E6U8_BRACR|nr:hypothetical protein DY000_02024014 [Brassica cretica]
MLSLKRAMTEQERVQKQFELKFNHLSDLLTKEMDKSQLLENKLAENLKKVRMFTTGTTTLDHLLTIGQCPSSSWGLGFQGSASKSAEETVFVKESSKGKEIQRVATQKPNTCLATELEQELGRYVATELELKLGRYVTTEFEPELGRYVATELEPKFGRYVATELFRNVDTTLVHAFSSTLRCYLPKTVANPFHDSPPF